MLNTTQGMSLRHRAKKRILRMRSKVKTPRIPTVLYADLCDVRIEGCLVPSTFLHYRMARISSWVERMHSEARTNIRFDLQVRGVVLSDG